MHVKCFEAKQYFRMSTRFFSSEPLLHHTHGIDLLHERHFLCGFKSIKKLKHIVRNIYEIIIMTKIFAHSSLISYDCISGFRYRKNMHEIESL